MPRLTRPIENQAIIEHNIALSLLDHLTKLLEIPNDNIVTTSKHNDEKNNDSNIDNMRGKEQKNFIIFSKYSSVIQDENNTSFRINKNYNNPILLDRNNFIIMPINTANKMTLTLSIESTSNTEIDNLINKIKLTNVNGGTSSFHDLIYRYYLPYYVSEFLYDIYEIRKEVKGDVDEYIDYLNKIKMKDLEYVSDIGGNNVEIAIIDRQEQALGNFNSNGYDLVATFDKDKNKYTLDIEYTLYYAMPTYFTINYSASYCNTMLKPKYLTLNNAMTGYSKAKRDVLKGQYDNIESYFKNDHPIKRYIHNKYVHIPYEDQYQEYEDNIGLTLFSALTLMEDDSQLLFNLEELGDVHIEKLLLKFIKESEYKYIGKDFNSFIQISLYENDKRILNGLEVTRELDVYSSHKLDKCKRYRVLLSVNLNIRELINGAYERLVNFLNMIRDEYGVGYKFLNNNIIPFYLRPLLTNEEWINDVYGLIGKIKDICEMINYLKDRDFNFDSSITEWNVKDQNRPDNFNMDVILKGLQIMELSYDSVTLITTSNNSYRVRLDNELYVYIAVENSTIKYTLYDKGNCDFILDMMNGIRIIKEGDLITVYKNGEIIYQGTSFPDILYTIFELVLGINLFIDDINDFTLMKTVQYSDVIAYSMRVYNE